MSFGVRESKMSERRNKIEALFEKALERPPDEREAWLAAHCDDAELRVEVERLLVAHARTEGLLEVPIHDLAAEIIAAPEDEEAMIEQRVGPYRLVEKIGRGGMGVVYKARHLKLGRRAALKFLPPPLATDETAKKRFLREARAASALDHPHLCTVYDVGETERGRPFIAMAYYEGETLKEKIARGPLPVEEALDLTVQIAEGLQKAHAAGILHRDLKPSNVMITDDSVVKILDFGLAKLEDRSRLTKAGARMGTVAYMSPEQARGEEVDARTDLWSLGVVLYEMLTGERPFRGDNEQAVIYNVRNEEPTPVQELRPEIPEPLAAVVTKCLTKDPARRYADVSALLDDVEALGEAFTPGRGLPFGRNGRVRAVRYSAAALLLVLLAFGVTWYLSIPASRRAVDTIAVLPFDNLSPDEQNQYFADGMTEDILTHLSKIEALRVTARTSVMPYQQTDKTIPQIADELGVRYILEGSVRRAGKQVRITAQLIDARVNEHIWAENYDRRLEDIFAVQSNIAKAIAGELEAELAPGVEERIEGAPTEDFIAYELFLRGREYVRRRTREGNEKGIALLRRAIERDPDFALARAALAKAYAIDVFTFAANARWADTAAAEAERAVVLAPDLAAAHTALGMARMGVDRYAEAVASFERALELNPNAWTAVNNLGIVYHRTGRTGRALRLWQRAAAGDPAKAFIHRHNIALAFREIGLLDRAERAARSVLALAPDNPHAISNKAFIDLFQGDTAAAIESAEQLASAYRSNARALLSAGSLFIHAGAPERAQAPLERSYALSPTVSGEGYVPVRLGYTLWVEGEHERAEKLFAEFERFAAEEIESGNESYLLRYSLAAMHTVRGETEEALRWLERAVKAGWPYDLVTISDPLLAPLRGEERFRALVDRMRERNKEVQRQLAQAEGREPPVWLPPKGARRK